MNSISINRRAVCKAFAALAAGIALPASARSGAYPNRPIELIVPFAAGGGTDVLARALAESARKHLPQSLIVVNKAGASGGVGWSELVNAKPDGYKLAIITVELTMIPHMGLTKITADDLVPIVRLNADPATLAVRADTPHQTIEDFLAAKKNAGGLCFGNAGPGSLGHLAAAALEDKTAVQLNHVPYRGANPAVLDLLGGHIDAVAVTPVEVAIYVAVGKIRPLAVMADQRIQRAGTRCLRSRSARSTCPWVAGAAWRHLKTRRPRCWPRCARPSPRPFRSPRCAIPWPGRTWEKVTSTRLRSRR